MEAWGVNLGVMKHSLLFRHKVIDRLPGLQAFLHLDKQLDSIHHHLNQIYLRETKTVCIGDVKDTTDGSGVDSAWRTENGYRSPVQIIHYMSNWDVTKTNLFHAFGASVA